MDLATAGMFTNATAAPIGAAKVVAALDWTRIGTELDRMGCATTGALLTAEACADLAALYQEEDR